MERRQTTVSRIRLEGLTNWTAAHANQPRHFYTRDLQVRHAAPLVPEVFDLQLAQLSAVQRVIKQGGQDRPVALALDRDAFRRIEQLPRLVVAQRRRLAFVAFHRRPLHALDRVVRHGVAFAQVLEQR